MKELDVRNNPDCTCSADWNKLDMSTRVFFDDFWKHFVNLLFLHGQLITLSIDCNNESVIY